MRLPALLLLFAAQAASEPDPDLQTTLLAALAVPKAVPGGRCLNQDMRAVKTDDVIEAVKKFPLDWSRKDLAEARASLARGSSPGRSIGDQEAAGLQRFGWSVFKFTGKRRPSCQLYVSVREPVIAGNYALTEVIYNPLPEDRGYVVPVLLQKYDYGWTILAVGDGYIVVI